MTVTAVPGTTQLTTGLSGSATTGADMAGMLVTAIFEDGFTETLVWGVTGATSGGVNSGVWSVDLGGNSFDTDWSLANLRTLVDGSRPGIKTLIFDAGPGDAVFDRTAPSFGTDGSFRGLDFDYFPGRDVDIRATYSDQVALIGDPPVGDLYRRLTLEFTNSGGFIFFGDFEADTDSLTISGDITPVPEPAMFVMLALGGFFLLLRRRAIRC